MTLDTACPSQSDVQARQSAQLSSDTFQGQVLRFSKLCCSKALLKACEDMQADMFLQWSPPAEMMMQGPAPSRLEPAIQPQDTGLQSDLRL